MAFVNVAAANDGVRYSRSGEAYPMVRSTTEFGVLLQDAQAAEGVHERLSAEGSGRMRLMPHASPESRWRIIEVADTGDKRRDTLLQVPNVESIRPVWRRAGWDVPVISTGRIIVRFVDGTDAATRATFYAEYGVTELRELPRMGGMYVLASDEGVDEMALAAVMHFDPRVLAAESDIVGVKRAHQVSADDPFFIYQWHLQNTGQPDLFGQTGTAGADLDIEAAWEITLGTDILVGMFDDACDYRHEDLRENYLGTGFDASLSSSDAGFNDPRPKSFNDRHGTAVMGLAVARPNSVGVRGVAPLAQFTATAGLSRTTSSQEDVLVYSFALQQEVDVHNNSWGYLDGVPRSSMSLAIETAFAEGRDLDGPGGNAPRGMVILFASGNDGIENTTNGDIELSSLPAVIAVGASNADDLQASYSNYGEALDFLAPSGDDFLPGMATVDNTDEFNYPEDGYNIGGSDELGFPQLDVEGKYHGYFSGTSAACPVAAGVAALCLSANRELSATQVRLILEHTSERIAEDDADYHPVTSFSSKYGYGRINAGAAVTAATQASDNNGQTWPMAPGNVSVNTQSGTITWTSNIENLEFLVVESTNPGFGVTFGFVPVDGACYVNRNNGIDEGQFGCEDTPDDLLAEVPEGVRIIHWTAATRRTFLSEGGKAFGLYARNSAGRYSWGVYILSNGTVVRAGESEFVIGGGGGGGNGNGGDPDGPIDSGSPPRVTIEVTPLTGTSPLTVTLKGNAVTDDPIVQFCCYDCNGNGTEDAFDIFNGFSEDANFDQIPDECDNDGGAVADSALIPCASPFSQDDAVRCSGWDYEDDGVIDTLQTTTQHTYTTPVGQTTTYRARLTFRDTEDRVGSQAVDIVVKPSGDDGTGGPTEGDVEILVRRPGGSDQDVESGQAPLDVELSIDADALPGSLVSVRWDLGDGTVANSISVLHTYKNTSLNAVTYPITAEVTTTIPSSEANGAYQASRLLRVEPQDADVVQPNANIGGSEGGDGSSTSCAMGILPLTMTLFGLMLIRRRFR